MHFTSDTQMSIKTDICLERTLSELIHKFIYYNLFSSRCQMTEAITQIKQLILQRRNPQDNTKNYYFPLCCSLLDPMTEI